jgi:hypothetical protein
MSLRPTRLALLAALVLPLLGCAQKITVCPIPAILVDTSTITIFRPGTTPDLANELYSVRLISAEADCVYNNSTSIVRASMDLTFKATRAPSSEGATYTVPYFVAVHEGPKIFAKRTYNLRFSFAPGAATATIKQAPEQTRILIQNGKLPWNYQLLSGFQLTPEQIEYNQKKARYLP